ncbi:predicted protein [Naegleria gruberi]|uniref:Predicted protein n=1 Tax=Naegleria gruberi TaxID=5762 RepID=D2VEU3_NAEGR|nr:uncharacterized protein NAEGRDRAFT_67395 [Naegleria gruberi]EFC44663.1 predicted protein [Naegleria gruberi]|eukprot:XP_002677407.1 predicted protein [Naegleria gruberi strain NEG-M]
MSSQVIITLDLSANSSLLSYKFHSTSHSTVKWFNNRLTLHSVYIPIEFSNDREYVKRNIEAYPDTFEYASIEIRSDKQFITDVIVKNDDCFDALNHMSMELKTDWDFILKIIEENSNLLDYANYCDIPFIYMPYESWKESQEYDDEYCNDNNGVIVYEEKAIEGNYSNNTLVNDELKTDIDACITCLREEIHGFHTVFQLSKNRENKELIERAVKEVSEIAFFYADEQLKNEKEFILHLIHTNPHVLLFTGKEFRRDKQIVMEAVKIDIETLNYVSGKLLKDEEFLNQAKSIGNYNYQKNYLDIVVDYARHNCCALNELPHTLRKNKDLMLKVMAVCSSSSSMKFVDESLINDKDFILGCIECMSPSALETLDIYLPHGMIQDPPIATSLVVHSPRCYRLLSNLPFISNDRELILKMIKKDASQYPFLLEEFKNDKEITREAVKQSSSNLALSSDTLKMDKEFILECILLDPESIKCTNLQYDQNFILQAVKWNGLVLKYCISNFGMVSNEIEIEAVKQNGFFLPDSQIIAQLVPLRMEYEYQNLYM